MIIQNVLYRNGHFLFFNYKLSRAILIRRRKVISKSLGLFQNMIKSKQSFNMCHSLGFTVCRLSPFVIENKRAKKPQILFQKTSHVIMFPLAWLIAVLAHMVIVCKLFNWKTLIPCKEEKIENLFLKKSGKPNSFHLLLMT